MYEMNLPAQNRLMSTYPDCHETKILEPTLTSGSTDSKPVYMMETRSQNAAVILTGFRQVFAKNLRIFHSMNFALLILNMIMATQDLFRITVLENLTQYHYQIKFLMIYATNM
jgi:hypothetical protein